MKTFMASTAAVERKCWLWCDADPDPDRVLWYLKIGARNKSHSHNKHLFYAAIFSNSLLYSSSAVDSVVGARGVSKKALLVLTERKTRKEIIFLLKDHTSAAVVKALDRLERKLGKKFREIFKSITVDNGSEFADWVCSPLLCSFPLMFLFSFSLFRQVFHCQIQKNALINVTV